MSAELEFPRLKTHSLHTVTCSCTHLDKTRLAHKHLQCVSSEHVHICHHKHHFTPEHAVHKHRHTQLPHTYATSSTVPHFSCASDAYYTTLCCFLTLAFLTLNTHSHAWPHTNKYTHSNITTSLAQLSQMLRAHRRFTGTTHGRKM